MKALWPISQEPDLSQIWDLRRNTANNINFHYWTNFEKMNDQIFQKFNKLALFCRFSPIWGIWLCHTQLYVGFWYYAKNFLKNYWSNSKKTSGQTDSFHRTLPGIQNWLYKVLQNLCCHSQKTRVKIILNIIWHLGSHNKSSHHISTHLWIYKKL